MTRTTHRLLLLLADSAGFFVCMTRAHTGWEIFAVYLGAIVALHVIDRALPAEPPR